MASNQASELLGKLNAINTVIENFPSSLLDLLHGPRYDNVIDFLIDVLEACGVDIHEVIQNVLAEVFNIKDQITSGITGLYESIENLEIDENGKFFTGLEYAVKGILMALLSSIFSCSALPILPNKYFDVGKNDEKFTPAMRGAIQAFEKLSFPISAIDPFGYLSVDPLSKPGRLYYKIEGKDVCYQKVSQLETVTYDETQLVPHCVDTISLCLKFGNNHTKYAQSVMYNSNVDNQEIEDELFFYADQKLEDDLTIDLKYMTRYNTEDYKHLVIKRGEQSSPVFNLTPFFGQLSLGSTGTNTTENAQREQYIGVKLSSGQFSGTAAVCVGKKHVYLSFSNSKDVIDFWQSKTNLSLSVGIPLDSKVLTDEELYNCPYEEHSTPVTLSSYTYTYEPCDYNDNAVYYDSIPDSATSADSDYILVHTGLVKSTLNRTYDMNAFLWYTMNKGYSDIQSEYNKTMWDSRIYARKQRVERTTPGEWNEWYNSKTNMYEELSCPSLNDVGGFLFPILQCYRHPVIPSRLVVEFPAQKFFKPLAKDTDNAFVYNALRINSTLYEYNWRYLNNIQIFKPKLILYGMLDALMDGIVAIKNGLSFNFTQQATRARLSEAIQKYITAVDTNVEDCYFEFSNEDLDTLLEEMLLSRYNSVIQDSASPTIKELSVDDYMASIDNINLNASQAGSVNQIMKTVNDISLKSEGNYQSVNYGIELGYDASWWKKVVMALAQPIIESIFTPQVILLIMINFDIMGITSKESLYSTQLSDVVNLLINKILGLVKSIIRYLIDKLKEILLRLVYKYLIPMISVYELLLLLERLDAWIKLLKDVATCVPMFNFSIRKALGQIDNVQYADIVTDQSTPESETNC